mgnify:CR=1 FL=1
MSAAPTICRTCGGPIESPSDTKHVCGKCERIDPSDLTSRIRYLEQREKDCAAYEYWIDFFTKISFRISVTLIVVLIAAWLLRQLL